jgi:hypothetical protein
MKLLEDTCKPGLGPLVADGFMLRVTGEAKTQGLSDSYRPKFFPFVQQPALSLAITTNLRLELGDVTYPHLASICMFSIRASITLQ